MAEMNYFQLGPEYEPTKAYFVSSAGKVTDVSREMQIARSMSPFLGFPAGGSLLLLATAKFSNWGQRLEKRVYVASGEDTAPEELVRAFYAAKIGHPLLLITTAAQRLLDTNYVTTIRCVTSIPGTLADTCPKTAVLAGLAQNTKTGLHLSVYSATSRSLAPLFDKTAYIREKLLSQFTALAVGDTALSDNRTRALTAGVTKRNTKLPLDRVALLGEWYREDFHALKHGLCLASQCKPYAPEIAGNDALIQSAAEALPAQWSRLTQYKALQKAGEAAVRERSHCVGGHRAGLDTKGRWNLYRLLSYDDYSRWLNPVLATAQAVLAYNTTACPLRTWAKYVESLSTSPPAKEDLVALLHYSVRELGARSYCYGAETAGPVPESVLDGLLSRENATRGWSILDLYGLFKALPRLPRSEALLTYVEALFSRFYSDAIDAPERQTAEDTAMLVEIGAQLGF